MHNKSQNLTLLSPWLLNNFTKVPADSRIAVGEVDKVSKVLAHWKSTAADFDDKREKITRRYCDFSWGFVLHKCRSKSTTANCVKQK